jgi:hypothetical protein
VLFAAFVVLALAAVYALSGLRHPAPAAGFAASRPGHAAVISSIRACAAPGSAGVTAGSLATAAVPSSTPTSTSSSTPAGSAAVTRLVPAGSDGLGARVATLTHADELALTPLKTAPALPKSLRTSEPGSSPRVSTQAGRGGIEVTASGSMAQGLAVEQTGPHGLVTEQCGSPGTSFWFVGPGQAAAADLELYLMNTDGQPADAEVTAITDVTKGGPVLGNADNGITVPPHGMVVQSLGNLVASSKILALNVATSVGRVVAALRISRSGADSGGWVPQTQGPARTQVIPGLPSASGARQLYVAVPGAATANIKVTAVTAKGSYQPTGGTGIELLGGSADDISLSALGGVPATLKITSSVPVVASMLIGGGPAGTPGAVAASAGPVDEQGVLAASPVGSAGATTLVLSAPRQAASVRVQVAAAGAAVTGQAGTVVQVKAKSTVTVPVKAPRGHRVSEVMIVVTPMAGSGPVYAARVITSGGVVQSIAPVPSSLTWILQPVVHSALSVIGY